MAPWLVPVPASIVLVSTSKVSRSPPAPPVPSAPASSLGKGSPLGKIIAFSLQRDGLAGALSPFVAFGPSFGISFILGGLSSPSYGSVGSVEAHSSTLSYVDVAAYEANLGGLNVRSGSQSDFGVQM